VGTKNSLILRLSLLLFGAGAFSCLFASGTYPACGSGTVASYITSTAQPPPTGGCAINPLDYFNFSYIPGSNAPSASGINVTTSSSGTGFSFGPVTAAAGQTVQFEIDYQIVIDPAPIITGDNLGLDPPTGLVTVTEFFCNDVSYIGNGLCLGGVAAPSLTVGTPGTGFMSSNTITFGSPARVSQNVGIVFTLDGGTAGASFDGLDTVSLVATPEPAAAGGLLLGLLTLASGYRLKKQRSR
jgi:hypothetical protein